MTEILRCAQDDTPRSMEYVVREMREEDIAGAVALQRACFPEPFPEEFLWRPEHLQKHIEIFPAGQLVAVDEAFVIGSASSCVIREEGWLAHRSWSETVGGPFIKEHDPAGSTLYGLDISVHPNYRGQGVGRALYGARFNVVRSLKLARYGTACRIPGFLAWNSANSVGSVEKYVSQVVAGETADRTLTPLLRYGLKFVDVIHDYMDDEESANAAALLEWIP